MNGKDLELRLSELHHDAIMARIAQFCDWFEIVPPKLTIRHGKIILTEQLLTWCRDSGASLDWIFAGEVRGMAQGWRTLHLLAHSEVVSA